MSRSEGLRVWHAAMELAQMIADVARRLPRGAPTKLRGQLESASNAIPALIAEGIGRGTPKEKVHYFRTSRGSVEETQTHLRRCLDLQLIDQRTFYRPWHRAVVVLRMLTQLIARIERGARERRDSTPG